MLVYELTSEPTISESDSWYLGELGGYTFVQNIVRELGGRDPRLLARNWIRLLSGSIRRYDRRHLIGIGLLPSLEGPFAPANVADLLDVLLVHVYPAAGRADDAISLVHGFASERVPVVLGETFPLGCGREDQEAFLLGSRGDLDGYLSFYDGRTPAEVGTTMTDALYAAALRQFLGLRSSLVP